MARFVICGTLTPTNIALRSALRALGIAVQLLPPDEAEHAARPGDTLLGRIDTRPTLDGIERGLEQLRRCEAAGLTVLNRPAALWACHDKLATALMLVRAGVPHPETAILDSPNDSPSFGMPVVVKPRFGSWGRDTFLCATERSLQQTLGSLQGRSWFQAHGALVQRLVPPVGEDLRIVVAAGEVVGAVTRVSAPGEWRTNVALGAIRKRVNPPGEARSLALAAAAAVGGDLVGVDLLPTDTGFTVLELNGCADFTSDYSLDGDVFERAALALLDPGESVGSTSTGPAGHLSRNRPRLI